MKLLFENWRKHLQEKNEDVEDFLEDLLLGEESLGEDMGFGSIALGIILAGLAGGALVGTATVAAKTAAEILRHLSWQAREKAEKLARDEKKRMQEDNWTMFLETLADDERYMRSLHQLAKLTAELEKSKGQRSPELKVKRSLMKDMKKIVMDMEKMHLKKMRDQGSISKVGLDRPAYSGRSQLRKKIGVGSSVARDEDEQEMVRPRRRTARTLTRESLQNIIEEVRAELTESGLPPGFEGFDVGDEDDARDPDHEALASLDQGDEFTIGRSKQIYRVINKAKNALIKHVIKIDTKRRNSYIVKRVNPEGFIVAPFRVIKADGTTEEKPAAPPGLITKVSHTETRD